MTDGQTKLTYYAVENTTFFSTHLKREVVLDFYLPKGQKKSEGMELLLVNDGQDLPRMPFAPILDGLLEKDRIKPLLVVGIYCNEDRKHEYGTADELDYLGRGAKAKFHRAFVLDELIPFVREKYGLRKQGPVAFAGFSLGGLSAIDIAWKHPEVFNKVGVFSGSFWWRSKDLNDGYKEETDRIMHKMVRNGKFSQGQRFFFQTGTLDEAADRNNNGIIDSIDDTLALIDELKQKGYQLGRDIKYLEVEGGHHDVPTWAGAFPGFLEWGWGK